MPKKLLSTGGSEGEKEELRTSKQERVVSNADQFFRSVNLRNVEFRNR